MFTKPPALKSPSIRQPTYSKDVQKQKNKTSPTTPTSLPKPNSLKITSNPKPIHQISPKNSPNVNTSTSSINTDINKQSFASTVANSLIPKKDQALLIDIDDNIPHKDYIIAIGNLVQPSNILFASRISKGRLCIFLSSNSLVNNLIDNNPYITIQQQQFKLRKFFNPNKRIILSNVYPNIPPDIIANEFIKLNIPLCSPITPLRAGIQVEDFTHILSFRRQTFIQHDDLIKLPPTILINYEDTYYRIFLSDDSLTCYLCKAQGHIASHCSNQINSHNIMSQVNNDQPIANTPSKLDASSNTYNTPIVPTSTSDTNTSPLETPNIASEPTSPSNLPPTSSITSKPTLHNLDAIPNSDIVPMDIDKPTGNKRSLPDSFLTHSPPPSPLEPNGNSNALPTPQNPVTPQNEIIEKKKKKNKKSKSAALTTFLENIDAYLEPAKKLFTDQNNFKIDFITFKHIFENNQGHFEPPTIYNEYNISKKDLLDIIMSIKPTLQNCSIKNRLTRFTKTLNAEPYDSYESEA
ncbi:DNA replication licensing factor MCM4-like [Aphis craccivora]|uniref:DNA replication licensing factor MCM4-like n=1 Tax=Aphis craccivora TaxID=307492 RepID=A0A6G0VTZ6_APHCR|nr:DNA replication licensing factor MCM4-like [Aphis craccivora]